MDLNEFKDYYLNELLHKHSSNNKSVILLGNFNVHFHNILRLFGLLPNFLFTTNETMRDYYL